MILTWEREFDELNKDPEENSDFDSDNEVNPLDTLVPAGTEYMPTPSITSENKRKRRPIQVSVIGRPNVGKSTLINSLLKEYRVVASDLPGTTRDSVLIEWAFKGRRIHLVDTAGLRPRRGPYNRLEEMLETDVQQSLNYSHVAVLLIDAMEAFTSQDMMLVEKIVEEGRSLVVVANKWDLVHDKYKHKAVRWMNKQLERGFGQVRGAPLCYVSAKNGLRVEKVLEEVLRVYEKWNTRVGTRLANKWLREVKKH